MSKTKKEIAKTPKHTSAKWADKLDRQDHTILSKVIAVGVFMGSGVSEADAIGRVAELSAQADGNYMVYPPPKNLKDGHALLRAALARAHDINPAGLLEVCASRSIYNICANIAKSPYIEHEAGFSEKILEAQCYPTDANAKAGQCEENLRLRSSVKKVLANSLTSRYRYTNPGLKVAPSSNALNYWDPARGGVVAFINGYVKQALKPEVVRLFSGTDPEERKKIIAGEIAPKKIRRGHSQIKPAEPEYDAAGLTPVGGRHTDPKASSPSAVPAPTQTPIDLARSAAVAGDSELDPVSDRSTTLHLAMALEITAKAAANMAKQLAGPGMR